MNHPTLRIRSRRNLALLLAVAALGASAGALRAEHFRFDVGAGGRLDIELDTGGSIDIRGGGSGVEIEATRQGRDADNLRVQAETTSQGVRVWSEFARKLRESSGGVDLVITVPDRYDVRLSSMGGGVRIEGVEGSFSGKTMGGELRLSHLRGDLALETMGGSIEVSDSTLDGRVSTMGGNVTIRRVSGGLQGKTMGGKVRIEDGKPSGQGDFTAETTGSTGVVELETMGGAVDVADAPRGARVKTMGGNVHIGSAKRFVEATTMGGKIRVDSVDGDLKASTMGGDVEAHVVGGGGDVDVDSKGGTLEIWLPAGFAAEFDVEIAYTRDSRRSSYEIKSDFPLSQSRTEEWEYGHGSPRKYIRAKGTSGGGGHKVTLRTINGDIVIHRGG